MALPGFEGRLGRLGFLGQAIGLAVVMGAATVALSVLAARGGHASPAARLLFVGAIVVPIWLYAGLSLQVRRLNDMGWPALPFIGGWFLCAAFNVAVAHAVPSLARPGGGTILGTVVNVVLGLVLLLWPGQSGDDRIGRELSPKRILPASLDRPRSHGDDTPPVLAAPVTRPTGFGRRTAGFGHRSA